MVKRREGDMRIMPLTVEKVSTEVERLTEGRFRIASYRENPAGDGRWEYLDAGTNLRWIGVDGAREACAYYIGAALGHMQESGQILPYRATWLRDVQDAYSTDARYRNWEEVGRIAARRLAPNQGQQGVFNGGTFNINNGQRGASSL